MDMFNVPKKINRHVLKALGLLEGDVTQFVPAEAIAGQVKYQIRNLRPIANIDVIIQRALFNLTHLGILARSGVSEYAIRSSVQCQRAIGKAIETPNTKAPVSPCARRVVQESSRKRSRGTLDPWKPPTYLLGLEPISGDSMTRAQKRLRTNNKRVKKVTKRVNLLRAVTKKKSVKTSRNSIIRRPFFCQKCRSALSGLTRPFFELKNKEMIIIPSRKVTSFNNAFAYGNAAKGGPLETVTFHQDTQQSPVLNDTKNASILFNQDKMSGTQLCTENTINTAGSSNNTSQKTDLGCFKPPSKNWARDFDFYQ